MPKTKYESDDGDIKPIRLAADTIAAAGAPPAGVVTDSDSAKVSKSNRQYGVRPRGVTLFRTLGTAPLTFQRYKFLPVLTPTAWASSAFAPSSTITVGATAWTVLARVPENAK